MSLPRLLADVNVAVQVVAFLRDRGVLEAEVDWTPPLIAVLARGRLRLRRPPRPW